MEVEVAQSDHSETKLLLKSMLSYSQGQIKVLVGPRHFLFLQGKKSYILCLMTWDIIFILQLVSQASNN